MPAGDGELDAKSPLREVHSLKRRILAGCLSALVPGTGQFLLHAPRSGAVMLAIFVALLVAMIVFRTPGTYLGLLVPYLSLVLLTTVSTAHVFPGRLSLPASLIGVLFVVIGFFTGAVIGALALLAGGFRTYQVPNSAMEPTVRLGEHIMVDRFFYTHRTPNRADVIVLLHNEISLTKRLIGLPGDTVAGEDGFVFVNGSRVEERYTRHDHASSSAAVYTFGPVTLDNNQLFVMGDNRDASFDSRYPQFGRVTLQDIRGKVLYILRSKDRDRVGLAVTTPPLS